MPFKDQKKRKEFNREYNREYMKRKRRENHAEFLRKETEWRTNNPAKRLILSTRQSAKKRGLDHTINHEDLVLPENCPYLGVPIDYSAGTGKTMLKPSVDRIDPSKGYVKGNVEVVSTLANTMKNKATKEQLVSFAKEVLRRWS